MDWWKLFALLITLTSFAISADGAKKKIRIHLPQKVKHIHHHKKIYITNHPASSQYAPAYLGGGEGGLAVPSNSVPFKSVDLYDERGPPAVNPAGSKLLPLAYRARGYYGPTPSEWDEQEYDLAPPPEPTGPSYVPTAFSAPSGPAASSNYPPKRVKVIKVKEAPRKKKIIRKRKPKRVVHEPPPVEEEHPVSTFHEQFYSDLDTAGTVKKIRKPKRVEKIIDGDTEHIHTYSEEHIHKIVFDDGSKLTGVAGGVDPLGSMSALASTHPLLPLKNHQALLGLDGQLEYSSYNPREVTHDHVFHDHGELPPNMELTKNSLGYPPKASYTTNGIKLGSDAKRYPTKQSFYKKPTKPAGLSDFAYYENIYSHNGRQKKPIRPSEASLDDYRPIPAFRYKDKPKVKSPIVASPYFGQSTANHNSGYQLGQASIPVPFSTSSTIVHDAAGSDVKTTAAAAFANFKDPFASIKQSIFGNNNFGLDTYASSSNLFTNSNQKQNWRNGKKQSISTQNVSFGGQDHKTIVDHLSDESHIEPIVSEGMPQHTQEFEAYNQNKAAEEVAPTPTALYSSITQDSPAHSYYAAMALKAFEEDPLESMPEASNDHFTYAEAPEPTAADIGPTAYDGSSEPRPFHRPRNVETSTGEPSYEPASAARPRRHRSSKQTSTLSGSMAASRALPRPRSTTLTQLQDPTNESPSARGKFKYGDKI